MIDGLEITEEEVQSAASNAIYWWNRDENYFHSNFKLLDRILSDSEALNFFVRVPFSQFLRLYSVRRSLPEGQESLVELLIGLKKFGFHNAILQGELASIDEASQYLIDARITEKHTRSFLSKFAFLINPSSFSLYDSLAKRSLYECLPKSYGFTRIQLEKYQGFHKGVELLFKHFETKEFFTIADKVLMAYPHSSAYNFFKSNQEAYYLRVVDKYLWQRQLEPENRLPSSAYLKFHWIGGKQSSEKN